MNPRAFWYLARRARHRWWTIAVMTLAGCAVTLEPGRMERAIQRISAARSDGAYDCAPRELALAEANLDFARAELAQGDRQRAAAHLTDTELNVSAAQRLTESSRCQRDLEPRSPTRERSRQRPSEDRDADGVPDEVDLCPDRAEDPDGQVDEDGCPEPADGS